MDIVNTITSYAKAVPAGLKAAGQELAKTAASVRGADIPAPSPARPKRTKTTAGGGTTRRKATRAKTKPTRKAKRPAAKAKRRKTSR